MQEPTPNGASPSGAQMTKSNFVNPKLGQVVQTIESQLSPHYVPPYAQILIAGMRILYAPATKQDVMAQLDAIRSPNQIPTMVRDGVTTLIRVIHRESRGRMKADAAMPAGHVLMCYVLDDIQAKTGIEITSDLLAATTQATTQGLLRMFGTTKAQIDDAIQASRRTRQSQPEPHAASTVNKEA